MKSLVFFAVLAILGICDGQPRIPLERGCSCAAISVKTRKLLKEKALGVYMKCDDKGRSKCNKLCMDLAKATTNDEKSLRPFCALYKQPINTTVEIHSRICGEPYKTTRYSLPKPVCCTRDNVPCKT